MFTSKRFQPDVLPFQNHGRNRHFVHMQAILPRHRRSKKARDSHERALSQAALALKL
jgi:hypothetical protein